MLCLWVNGQLNTAIRGPSRILELQDRLKGKSKGMVAGVTMSQQSDDICVRLPPHGHQSFLLTYLLQHLSDRFL